MKTRWRRVLCLAVFPVLLGFPGAVLAGESDWDWNYNIFYGKRIVDKNKWSPFENYEELGVEASLAKADQPLRFATDLYVSRDDDRAKAGRGRSLRVDSRIWEVDLGLRKIWTAKKRIHGYFGAGFALLRADFEFVDRKKRVSDDDLTPGIWLGGGVFWRVGPQLNLGIAGRYTPTKPFHLAGKERDGSSPSFGVIIGWGAVAAEK